MIHLYVKRHNDTGLLYFGKTTRDCPYSYLGSGKYWLRHLKKHGKSISTLHVWSFDDVEKCREFALKFSMENDIVTSSLWANLRPENGIDGIISGTVMSPETRAKISATTRGRVGKPHSEETRAKISSSRRGKGVGKTHSEMTKLKMRITKLAANNPNYKKSMPDEEKKHLSEQLKGRKKSSQTKLAMRSAAKKREAQKRLTSSNSTTVKIWHTPKEKMRCLAAESSSFGELCRKLNVPNSGGYRRSIRSRLHEDSIVPDWLT